MIWLKHEQHGIKNCNLESEAIADEKNGWIRFEPCAQLNHIDNSTNDDIDADNDAGIDESLEFVAPKKRGRPFGNK